MESFGELERITRDVTNALRYEAVTNRKADKTILKYRDFIGWVGFVGSAVITGYVTDRALYYLGLTNHVFSVIRNVLDVFIGGGVGIAMIEPSLKLGEYIGMQRVKYVLDQNYLLNGIIRKL